MLRTLEDIINIEFGNEIDNIKSITPLMAQHAYDGLRLMQAYEKIFPTKTIALQIRKGTARLPIDFYKENLENGTCLCDTHNSGNAYLNSQVCFNVLEKKIDIKGFDDGEICLKYYALPSDENGLPLITDEYGIDIAISAYLRYINTKAKYFAGEVGIERMQVAKKGWEELRQTTRGMAKMPTRHAYTQIVHKIY